MLVSNVNLTLYTVYVQIILCSFKVAEWPPYGKELLTRLTVFSVCNLSICNFSYFSFWFRERDFGFNCTDSCSLLTFC